MNRHQKRRAEALGEAKMAPKIPQKTYFASAPETPQALQTPQPSPSLLLRIVASVILSRAIRRRVKHPAARSALAVVAREVGKPQIAEELEAS